MPSQAQQGVQRGPQPNRLFPIHNNYVPSLSYAADVAKDGRVDTMVQLSGPLAGITIANFPVCKMPYGAKITGTGAVRGFDYLGQPIGEVLAGESKMAYYNVTQYPAGCAWLDKYGLPYAYASAGVADATITITAPTGVAGEDTRGTFVVNSGNTAGTRKLLSYVPVAGNLHGTRYVAPTPIPLP
jgi:hypothetical protein